MGEQCLQHSPQRAHATSSLLVIVFISEGNNTDKLIITLLRVDSSNSPSRISRVRGINAFIFTSDNGLKSGKLKILSRGEGTNK
jgi:hypothetical protein